MSNARPLGFANLGVCRINWSYLFNPKVDGDSEYYTLQAFKSKHEKDNGIQNVENAVAAVLEEKFGTKPNWPKGFKCSWRDGDLDTRNGAPQGQVSEGLYKDSFFITVNKKPDRRTGVLKPPGIFGPDRLPTSDPTSIKDGDYCVVLVNFYWYDIVTKEGTRSKGISAELVGVQKVRDGDPIGAQEFNNFEDEFEVLAEPVSAGVGTGMFE